MYQKGCPISPLPLTHTTWAASQCRESSCGSKGPSLSLEAGELTLVVVTEFLTFNRGGKIVMFPLRNGAIKLHSVRVYVSESFGGREQMHA